VTCKGEEEGEEEEDKKEEGELSGGAPLQLEHIGDMGVPMHLKLSAGASQQSNLAAITDAISTIMEVIKTTRSDNLPIKTLQDSQVRIHLAELGCVLLLSNWADLPNDIRPLTSGSIARVKDTFSYCFKGAPTEAIIPPTPVALAAAAPPPSTQELSVHPMELDLDLPADGPEVAIPRAPSKKAQGKRKESASGTFRPSLGSAFPPRAPPASALPLLPASVPMDLVPEEIVAPEAVHAASSSKAGPSRPASPPMKYWPAPPKAPSAPKKVHITAPVTGKQTFAQAMNPTPKPSVKPQSLALDLTPETIVALACAFPNIIIKKILELRATLTGASGALAPHPPTPALSVAMSRAPPPAKKPKMTTQGPSRKILLLSFDGFIPEVNCTKAVDDIFFFFLRSTIYIPVHEGSPVST
jgi:hypothetical protein